MMAIAPHREPYALAEELMCEKEYDFKIFLLEKS